MSEKEWQYAPSSILGYKLYSSGKKTKKQDIQTPYPLTVNPANSLITIASIDVSPWFGQGLRSETYEPRCIGFVPCRLGEVL
jgi:hypothetical protein